MAIGSWSRKVAGNEALGKKVNNNTQSTREFNNSGSVMSHSYEPGTEQKVVIPLVDGKPVIFNVPVHKVRKDGSLQYPKKDGGTFKGYEIRSMHPFSQGNQDVALEIAERGEVCVIHELNSLQDKKAWANARAQFGEDLKSLSESERKELAKFIKEQEAGFFFKPCYYPAIGEGDTARTTMDTVILLLQYQTETKLEKTPSGIEKAVETVVLDDEGQPKYRPVLFNLSTERATKVTEAIDNALDQGILSYDDLHPFTDLAGTDAETQVNIAWVDLTLKWPSGSKMESGRNLSIIAVPAAKKIVTPELIESFENGEVGKKALESAERMYFNRPANKTRTRQEQLESLSSEALRVYNELSEEFAEELERDRANFKTHVFDRILSQHNGESTPASDDTNVEETAKVEDSATVDEPVEEEAPKKPASKANIEDLLSKVRSSK